MASDDETKNANLPLSTEVCSSVWYLECKRSASSLHSLCHISDSFQCKNYPTLSTLPFECVINELHWCDSVLKCFTEIVSTAWVYFAYCMHVPLSFKTKHDNFLPVLTWQEYKRAADRLKKAQDRLVEEPFDAEAWGIFIRENQVRFLEEYLVTETGWWDYIRV